MFETPDGVLRDDAAAALMGGGGKDVLFAQWCVLVASSAVCALPAAAAAYRREYFYEMFMAVGVAVAACCHHTLETTPVALSPLLLGLDEGRWHRLQKVFTVLSCAAWTLRAARVACPRRVELLQTLYTLVIVAALEHAPWEASHTTYPLVAAAVTSHAVALVEHLQLPPHAPPRPPRAAEAACVFAALVFTVRAYDKAGDWMRASHGFAHALGWLAVYLTYSRP